MYLVEVLSALLAEVLVGRALLGHDADAGAMLPHLADVALHEEARNIVCNLERRVWVALWPIAHDSDVFPSRRRAGVLVEAADAADGLVVLLNVVAGVTHV
jgi:hypothetical protein